MKKSVSILITFVLATSILFGQEKLDGILPLKDGKICYSGVIEVSGVDVEKVFDSARKWIVMNYFSDKPIVEMEDKKNLELVAEGYYLDIWNMGFIMSDRVEVWNKIWIKASNGKLDYKITAFRIRYTLENGERAYRGAVNSELENWLQSRDANRKKFYEQTDTKMKERILSLKNSIPRIN
ncbi:hypothetical protein SDC9_76385 [bioreactor metagenome]|uniref:DUF4468 domain-containing protein n=1 Tax=bioreactor metagenome TaxID=1076179 RepID=A0A644YUZ1_9ZZZZ|nr:DUF4468 domain-containing protein [Rikenellaceae bacterium]